MGNPLDVINDPKNAPKPTASTPSSERPQDGSRTFGAK